MNKYKLPFEESFLERSVNKDFPHHIMDIIHSRVAQKFTNCEFSYIRNISSEMCKEQGIIYYNAQNRVFYSELVNCSVIKKWMK